MKKKVAVVIPYYHYELTELEKVAFHNCFDVLGKYPIVLLIPEKMKEHVLAYSNTRHVIVPDLCMESIASYNQMMLSKELYTRFMEYEYILIFQLDAFVFSDRLEYFCDLGYDYIGAPWLRGWEYRRCVKKGIWHVGNGGFSLRRVSAFLEVLDTQPVDEGRQEDLFWSSCESEHFHVAPMKIALQFSFEQNVRQCYHLNNNCLPFGCHAWEKYDFDFWRPYFEQKGYYLKSKMPKGLDKISEYQRIADWSYLEAKGSFVKKCLEELTDQNVQELCVFGAGKDGRECIWLLRHSGIHDITWVDNNPEIWNSWLWGVRIDSPEVLKNNKMTVIIVAVRAMTARNEILSQLSAIGGQAGQKVIFYSKLVEKLQHELEEELLEDA